MFGCHSAAFRKKAHTWDDSEFKEKFEARGGSLTTARNPVSECLKALADALEGQVLDLAAGLLAGALVVGQVVQLQVACLAMGAVADTAGVPSAFTVQFIGAMERSLEPLLTEALSFDVARIQRAWAREAPALEHAQAALTAFGAKIEEGAELSRKAIAMADAAMMVLSIYQVGLALGGAAGEAGPMLRPGGPSGVAVATVPVAISAELQAALRRLIQGGALNGLRAPTRVAGASIPELGKPALMQCPSGSLVPTEGPRAGSGLTTGSRVSVRSTPSLGA